MGDVCFVDAKMVPDLIDPGLQRLTLVPELGHKTPHSSVNRGCALDFCLPRPDCLDYDYVHSRGIENPDRVYRGASKTSNIAARSHATDVDLSFETMVHHTYSVA